MATETIGAVGDRASITLWESNNGGAITEVETGQMIDGSYSESPVTFAGATGVSVSVYRTLVPETADIYDLVNDSGCEWSNGAIDLVNIDEDHFRCGNFRAQVTLASATTARTIRIREEDIILYNMVAVNLAYTGNNVSCCNIGTSSGCANLSMFNCVMIGNGGTTGARVGYSNIGDYNGSKLFNCGSYNHQADGYGYQCDIGDDTIENCWGFSNGNKDFEADTTDTVTFNYNCSGDGTADDWHGTGHQVNKVLADTFQDAANHDFRLKDTNSALHDNGTDKGAEWTTTFFASQFTLEAGVDHEDENTSWEIGPYDGLVVAGVDVTYAPNWTPTADLTLLWTRERPYAASITPTADFTSAFERDRFYAPAPAPTADFAASFERDRFFSASMSVTADVSVPDWTVETEVPFSASMAVTADFSAVLSRDRDYSPAPTVTADFVVAWENERLFAASITPTADFTSAFDVDKFFTGASITPTADFASVLGIDRGFTGASITPTADFVANLEVDERLFKPSPTPTADFAVTVGVEREFKPSTDIAPTHSVVASIDRGFTGASITPTADFVSDFLIEVGFIAAATATADFTVGWTVEKEFSASTTPTADFAAVSSIDRGFIPTTEISPDCTGAFGISGIQSYAPSFTASPDCTATFGVEREFKADFTVDFEPTVVRSIDRGFAAAPTATADFVAAFTVDQDITFSPAVTLSPDFTTTVELERGFTAAIAATADVATTLGIDRPFAAAIAPTADFSAAFTNDQFKTFAPTIAAMTSMVIVFSRERGFAGSIEPTTDMSATTEVERLFSVSFTTTADIVVKRKTDFVSGSFQTWNRPGSKRTVIQRPGSVV